MLAKRKKNMFMSSRGCSDPGDSQCVSDEIKLNVRRGLARLKSDKPGEAGTAQIASQLSDLAIDDLTSIDIAKDFRSHYRTHERRMRDIIYTKKLWKAICGNAHLFKDKIVLDVSCNMGVLAMFSAIAGAEHVYAIDTSNIVELTERVVADNHLSHKITVIKGAVAGITLPVAKVDIIVSTFFGQSLLCENRLDELIDAREKWLKPNGLIFPDQCTLHIAAINNSMLKDRSNFWQHVNKFDMRPMIQAVNFEPYLQYIQMEQVVTSGCAIKHINMYTVDKDDYRQFDAPFCLKSGYNAYIGGFFTYFDIQFTEGVHPITFSIQPGWKNTSWCHMVFFLSMNDFLIDIDEKFYGVFRFNALSNDYRKIDWNIEIMHRGKHCTFRDEWHFKTR